MLQDFTGRYDSICTLCPSGSYSAAGSAQCTDFAPCPPGSERLGQSSVSAGRYVMLDCALYFVLLLCISLTFSRSHPTHTFLLILITSHEDTCLKILNISDMRTALHILSIHVINQTLKAHRSAPQQRSTSRLLSARRALIV